MQNITLQDCYKHSTGRAFATGTQSLVRLVLEQARLDHEAGLNTRGLVSGYPGSPLGGLDHEMSRAKPHLDAAGVIFQPAVNEELAATALWGSQHLHLYDNPDIDGVFGLWYGKGPGLDRALDAMRHANMGGVAKHGGMVFAVGDDATGKSSTVAYQSEQTLIAAGVPFFYPRSVHDIIPMGLQAFALSRHAGCCVGLKIVVDTADISTIIDLDKIRPANSLPDTDVGPVHIGRHDAALERESRLFNLRLPAVTEFQRHHKINHDMGTANHRGKLGIMAVGKAVPEVVEALASLGVTDHQKAAIGLLSIGMPWPIAPQTLIDFATRYDEILVVEEKRPIVEEQLARAVVNIKARGIITGKLSLEGTPLIPETGELSHALLCDVIYQRGTTHGIKLQPFVRQDTPTTLPAIATRTPWFCAGCPHNSSTKLPAGEITGMGIGCHSISGFLTPDAITNYTQMGGEGAFWIGRAPFSQHKHSFQNIGDGTYAHSGYLGVRAAVAAGVNMTFKILYNGAVAMTGGQAVAGGQTPWMISAQLAAEGVREIAVVTDQPDAFPTAAEWAKNATIYHRSELLSVQDKLKEIDGVTAIIYVQSCATELRRGRKRGTVPDRAETVLINDAVCEGCGDCAEKSNCVAVKPLARPDGDKKYIDQSICNKDFSCITGFCPSFVTVSGQLDKGATHRHTIPFPEDIPLTKPARADGISNIFIAGIGGTGVSTLSGILVMAAHSDGIYGQAVNQTGLSQKNGGVTSQVRLSRDTDLYQRMVRLPAKGATLLIGCDGVVAANDAVLAVLHKTTTTAVVNSALDPVGVAGVGIGSVVSQDLVMARLQSVMDDKNIHQLDASKMADRLFGSTTSSNIILLGWALQKGFLPVRPEALEDALRLNGVGIEDNIAALRWGRLLAIDPGRVMALLDDPEQDDMPATASAMCDYFYATLTAYQDQAYAGQFLALLSPIRKRLQAAHLDDEHFGKKIAQLLYRAMAIKDEYEVARLLTSPAFHASISKTAGPQAKLHYHLAPPMLSWLKDSKGQPRKVKFGGWLTPVLRLLAQSRRIREKWYDPFSYGKDRRHDCQHRAEVISWLNRLSAQFDHADPKAVDAVLDVMLSIRGYGHIRLDRYKTALPKIEKYLAEIEAAPAHHHSAAE